MSGSGGGVAAREVHVHAALKRVEHHADGLLQSVQRLTERLSAVMRPQPPTLASKKPTPRVGEINQSTAPMAEQLDAVHEVLIRVSALLDAIEHHLEI